MRSETEMTETHLTTCDGKCHGCFVGTPETDEAVVAEFQEKHDGEWCLTGCVDVNRRQTKDAISDWLRTAEAAIRADQDRVTRERIADAIKTNSIPRALVTVQGEAFFRKLDLLNHLSANTTEE
jgi:hypothetical protein